MADITAIRAAIADTLLDVFGTDGAQAELGITVTSTVETPPNPPALQVLKGETDYAEAMQGSVNRHDMIVRAFASAMPADEQQQNLLDALCSFPGDASVKAALEVTDDQGETTLNGRVGAITVLKSTAQRVYIIEGNPYLGADLLCEVWA